MPLDMNSVGAMQAPRQDPREEHGQMLGKVLEDAQMKFDAARQVIAEQEPVIRSCRRALEELSAETCEGPSPGSDHSSYR